MKFVRPICAIATGLVITACGSGGASSGNAGDQDGGGDAGGGRLGVGGMGGSGGAGGVAGAKGTGGVSSSGGNGSGGGTCAELLACCNSAMDAQFRQACMTEYGQAKPSGDAICGSLLASFKQAYCP